MRERIIDALENADQHPKPEDKHAEQTWALAKNALAQNEKQDWHLLENPSRLRIRNVVN